MSTTLRTNVAQAFWCSLENSGARFERATFPRARDSAGTQIAWFDQLLDGGIKLPDSPGKPLVLLITGTPGSGKTILAIELC